VWLLSAQIYLAGVAGVAVARRTYAPNGTGPLAHHVILFFTSIGYFNDDVFFRDAKRLGAQDAV
jgi:hypothetical protein